MTRPARILLVGLVLSGCTIDFVGPPPALPPALNGALRLDPAARRVAVSFFFRPGTSASGSPLPADDDNMSIGTRVLRPVRSGPDGGRAYEDAWSPADYGAFQRDLSLRIPQPGGIRIDPFRLSVLRSVSPDTVVVEAGEDALLEIERVSAEGAMEVPGTVWLLEASVGDVSIRVNGSGEAPSRIRLPLDQVARSFTGIGEVEMAVRDEYEVPHETYAGRIIVHTRLEWVIRVVAAEPSAPGASAY